MQRILTSVKYDQNYNKSLIKTIPSSPCSLKMIMVYYTLKTGMAITDYAFPRVNKQSFLVNLMMKSLREHTWDITELTTSWPPLTSGLE